MKHILKFIAYEFDEDKRTITIYGDNKFVNGKITINVVYMFNFARFLIRCFQKMSSKKRRTKKV